MITFKKFDALAQNDFWTAPIENINLGLEKNLQKDLRPQTGITLVIGCALPEDVQAAIVKIQSQFEKSLVSLKSNAKVLWRSDVTALHITVAGLVIPKDYKAVASWQQIKNQLGNIKEIFNKYAGFTLTLKGLGILGRGAISIRVSDSPELEKLRSNLKGLAGISKVKFGSHTTKIVIGRVQPQISETDRRALQSTCDALQTTDLGTIKVNQLNLLHYQHTFLDRYLDKVAINAW